MEALDALSRREPPTGNDARPENGGTPPRWPQQRVDSEQLLRGAREIEIQHGQALYRLRHTASGKLILTK